MTKLRGALLGVVLGATLATRALAQAPGDVQALREGPRDAKADVPITAFTYTATGAPARSVGAYGYGSGLAGSGQRTTGGGGVTVWGSPVDRLTLVADAPRDVYLLDNFAPSFAAIVRLMGNANDGFSLGGLAKYKVQGFGGDSGNAIESEVEGGLLFSYTRGELHLDLNAIAGLGLAADGEIDTEGRLRVGYDVASILRVGIDGQGRWRMVGDKNLPNGSTWDFVVGPQVVLGRNHWFGSLIAGPTTMGLTRANVVGATAVVTLGGAL